MKKAGKILLIAGIVFLSLIFMYACQKDNGQVPVYQGMTVRKNINSVPQNACIDYADYPLNAPHYDNGNNKHGNGKGDPHIGHREELPNEIEDIISIDVVTDDEVKYYVQPNEVFIIEVHIDNPNSYEIQSFTLNGQKYANYMFKEGSTMELLLLETTAPSTSGYIGYSIDAIKYIDGTEIKDVDMSSGNKTIKAGIAYTAAPTAEVSNEKISTSSFSFDVTVTDENDLIGNNELMVYLSDGEKQIAEKAIQVGENSVAFDNLVMSKMYEYGIVTSFDMVDGRNIHSEWLYTKEITTLGAYLIENVNIGKEEILFDVNKVGEVGTIDSISLYDANTNEIVQYGSSATRSFNGLLSNHTYNLYVDFSYTINGETITDWAAYKAIKTLAKEVPTINLANLVSTQTSFAYETNITDADNVGQITKIELLHGNDEPISVEDLNSREFIGLLSNNEYSVKVTYTYDLNDGEGSQVVVAKADIKTLAKEVPVVSLTNFIATKTEITCVLDYTDTDDIGIIDEVYIANGDNAVQTTDERENLIFNSLQSGVKYTVVVKYSYDLNDGYGIHNDVYTVDYPTLVDSIAVEEIILLNNNVVKSGEELNMRIYFINPSEIEMTAIYINGQQVSVVGGDRVESAIIKFVPSQIGLIDFSVDKVDYLLDNIPVSQRVDSEIAVQYPIYGDLGVTFTPVTSLYYDVSGDGTYLEFDNSYNYNVYKINGTEDFITLGDGQYYYFGNRIDMIEYGYDDYGHTTQTFTYDAKDIVSINNDWWGRDNFYTSVVDYKKISTVEEFLAMTDDYYYLTNDIDARNVTITKQIDFTGVLVGNGYKIRGLQNVIDTANTDYYNIFNRGSFYDVNFTELYISVNGTSEKQVTVLPLGDARLVNCSVKGDINGNEYVVVGNIYGVYNTTSYNYNVTINNVMETRKFTATNILEKNENVEITESGTVLFTFPNGKKYLFGTFDTDITTLNIADDITVIGGGAFTRCNLLTEINIPENALCAEYVFGVCPLKKANLPVNVLNRLPDTRTTIEELIITGKGVIYYGAFQNCSLLTSVTIGNGVTSICDYAFSGCSSLTSVNIGNGVTSIGSYAFSGCSKLTSINIPDSVTSIGSDAFKDCPIETASIPALACSYISKGSIKTLVITSGYIEGYALYECTGLTSVTIGNSVTSIGNSAFSGCSSLTSVNIGNGVTSIGSYAFYGCSKLTSVNIPDSVTSIGELVFYGCSSLTSITIPDSVTSIGWAAFYGCSSLTSINIPDSVTSIGNSAFSGCSKLTSVNIPDGVMSIGERTFEGCSSLTSINIPDSVTSIGEYAFAECSSLTNITIPDSATSIGDYAFYECSSLTSVTIGNGVTNIGERTFDGCSSLTSVNIGNGVTSIGNDVFYDCRSLTSIYYTGDIASWCGISGLDYLMSSSRTLYIGGKKVEGELIIPDSVTSIGDYAFYYCSGLTSVNIGNGVTSIGWGAFYGCSSLTSIYYTGDIASWCGIRGLVDIMSSSRTLYIGGNKLEGELIIPDSVTSIGSWTFSGCSSLTSVNIPDSVTSIGNDAFYGCSGLTSVTIGNSVTSIGNSAFSDCSKLTNIIIPDGVTSIGDHAFYYCSGLTSVTMGNGVTSIGECAFECCYSLNKVYYGGTKQNKENIEIASWNDSLTYATWYYYAEQHPTEAGNYWYYDNGKLTIGANGEHTYANDHTCEARVCTICGYTCAPTTEHDIGENCLCSICGQDIHNYQEGVCIRCGDSSLIPEGAVVFNGHTYYLYTEFMSWNDAESYCESIDGHLATITTAEEQAFIESNFSDQYWIGGSNINEEGIWKWVTGETWNYTNWLAPNMSGVGGYLFLSPDPAGCWVTSSVDYSTAIVGFICEWDFSVIR